MPKLPPSGSKFDKPKFRWGILYSLRGNWDHNSGQNVNAMSQQKAAKGNAINSKALSQGGGRQATTTEYLQEHSCVCHPVDWGPYLLWKSPSLIFVLIFIFDFFLQFFCGKQQKKSEQKIGTKIGTEIGTPSRGSAVWVCKLIPCVLASGLWFSDKCVGLFFAPGHLLLLCHLYFFEFHRHASRGSISEDAVCVNFLASALYRVLRQVLASSDDRSWKICRDSIRVAPPHHPKKRGLIHMWPTPRFINPTWASNLL